MTSRDKIHVLSRAVIIDQNQILLCKTLDLDINFYFLPGGHVEHGESAENSLLRELREETGFECQIKKFLGCLEYSFPPGYNSICHNHEYNFIFEATSWQLKSNQNISSPEKHIALTWLPIASLSKIDFRAQPLKELIPAWLSGSKNNLLNSEMLCT